MAATTRGLRLQGADIAVVTAQVPASGWHVVDLARIGGVTSGLRGGARLGAVVASGPGRVGPAAPRLQADRTPVERVPNHALISVARATPREPSWLDEATSRNANDNASGPTPARTRSVWRDVVFLALLFATVAGAFWSGRLHAVQRVIVVPDASHPRSVVT